MRLICPNCDAEYEVDDNMIPPEGRDVQCSNCETVWFQTHADKVSETPGLGDAKKFPDGVGAAAMEAARGAQKRTSLDPDALAVIEEEVAFETSARKAEADAAPRTPAREPDVKAHVKELAEDELRALEKIDAEPVPQAQGAEDASAKSGRLPDVEEINSNLAAAPDPVHDDGTDKPVVDTRPARRARGFRLGFGLMLLVAAALLMAYVYSPQLAERFPEMTEQLSNYVSAVDSGRVWLDSTATNLIEKINGLIGQMTGEV